MDAEPALELSAVTKRYRRFALQDVSLSLPRGHILGLIGPNGAGKTTLVKLIMNLVRRQSGQIRVFGLDNLVHEVEVKARIGFVYDRQGLWDDQTLETHRRALGRFYPTWSDATFDRLAAEFGLPLRQKAKTLSLGERAKFALAMALSHEADLLVMDEPTSGLDPVFRRELLHRFSGFLQEEGRSILFSTHITADLERVADYIAFLKAGQLVFCLPRDTVLDQWGIVRGGPALLPQLDADLIRGVRQNALSLDVLVSDREIVRRRLGQEAVIDRVTLDELMVIMTTGGPHAA
ncbi:MAG: ABC transporter ATP-binding protein [Candidatus Latescibacterota bacterium]|jgi:ABC-2 type transport system ATP-binding protein